MELIDKTGAFKNGSKPTFGRLQKSYGYDKKIGRQSFDDKVRWRLDYDSEKGVHYNFEDFSKGKGEASIKIEILIDIDFKEYQTIIDWFNR